MITSVSVSTNLVSQLAGSVVVSATTAHATSCTLSSDVATPGLPSTIPCASGSASWTVFPPENVSLNFSTVKFQYTAQSNSSNKVAQTFTPKIRVAPGAGGGVPTNVVSITSGDGNYCALLNSTGVDCWGIGSAGQLGSGTMISSTPNPLGVVGVGGVGRLNGVRSVTSNGFGFCAILISGGVDCWGSNTFGELGDGTFSDSAAPVPVLNVGASAGSANLLTGVQSMSGSGPTYCALLTSGGVDCWGAGADGQLGDGATTDSTTPVQVQAPPELGGIAISGASEITGLGQPVGETGNGFCAVLASAGSDSVACWGANGLGQLGDGTLVNSDVPMAVETSTASFLQGSISQIVSDGNGFCAVESGGVSCWGDDFFGELGDGSPLPGTSSDFALQVVGVGGTGFLSGVQSLVANVANSSTDGSDGYCALLSSGLVECWGSGDAGQLGSGTVTSRSTPLPVVGSTAPVTFLSSAQSVVGNTANPFTTIGWPSFCAIITANLPTTPGAVACWGNNIVGNLGNGSVGGGSDVAGLVVGVGGSSRLSGVQSLTADGYGYCGLLGSGSVDCWGDGSGSPSAKTMS